MHVKSIIRTLLKAQGIYIAITALWALLHVESFMHITGYKTDVWLVKTVAAVLIPIALCCFAHLYINDNYLPAAVLCVSTALALGCVDVYYVLTKVIAPIYLADAFIEAMFVSGWLYVSLHISKPVPKGYY